MLVARHGRSSRRSAHDLDLVHTIKGKIVTTLPRPRFDRSTLARGPTTTSSSSLASPGTSRDARSCRASTTWRSRASCPSSYRIVGCGRPTSKMTHDDFRSYAYDAVNEFASEAPTYKEWAEFSSNLTYAIDPDDGPEGLPGRRGRGRGCHRRRGATSLSPGDPARRHARRHLHAGHPGPQQERAHRLREALRHRPRLGQEAERRDRRVLR